MHILVCGLLLCVNFGLYYRTASLGFLSVDDPDYVINNQYITDFSTANLKHIFTTPYAANYAPANLLSYALDVALAGGKNATALHLSSIAWHAWVALTVYFLAFTLRAEIVTATAAALLFVLHPAHVEVVAWLSSRKDLVATGFALLSMAAYVRWRRAGRKGGCWYGVSWLAFLVASAGKQSVLLLPALMLLWDILVERRRELWMFAEKIPFGLITLFFGWMTWQAQPPTNQHTNFLVLAATELTNFWLLTGFGKYALYRVSPNPEAWSVLITCATLLAALLAWAVPLFFQIKHRPLRTLLGYWVLINLIPPMLLNFIVPITDRYLFLSSVGVCLLAADLLGSALARNVRLAVIGHLCATALAVWWAVQTWNYVSEWVDPRSVWYGARQKTENPQVAQFLGEVYHEAGDRLAAFVSGGKALNLTNETSLAKAVLNGSTNVESLRLEWAGIRSGRTSSAVYRDELWGLAWEQYLFAAAHRGTLSMPNLFINRGRLLISLGKSDKAIPEFQAALAFAETSTYSVIREETTTHALRAVGVAYWNLRKYADAEEWLLKAQANQRKFGVVCVPTLDHEVEQVKALAAAHPK